jgi:predicted nucleic acid-binding protein
VAGYSGVTVPPFRGPPAALLQCRPHLYIARITDVEMTSALARRRQGGSLNPAQAAAALQQFRRDFAQDYLILDITTPLLQLASRMADTHGLRAYDAVQLAAALEVRAADPTMTLISADIELNTAAVAEGVAVDNPNHHP